MSSESVASADGTSVELFDEGRGAPIVIVHGGSQRATDWKSVAGRLVDHFRVIRVDRALYSSARPVERHTMGREVDDVDAVLSRLSTPAVLLGHSSGAVVALEAARRLPTALAGLLLYEPPVAVDAPVGGDALVRAETAIADGDPGAAMEIHLKEIVQFPRSLVWLARHVPSVWNEMCAPAAAQIADTRAIESLGVDLERYGALDVPALLLGGGRSPPHLTRRLEALARMLPRARTLHVRSWGHLANLWSPRALAAIVRDFASACFERRAA